MLLTLCICFLSGLDAESAIQVIRFLRRYVKAAPGRRVIITIHQPSSFIWEMLDDIVLLAKGHLVYQGSRNDIKSFFDSCDCHTPEDYNPADYFLTVTNDDFEENTRAPDWWEQSFLEWNTREGNENEHQTASFHSLKDDLVETQRGTFFHQVTELVRRYFTNLMLNPGILFVRIVMYVMLALIIGALFWKIGESYSNNYIIPQLNACFDVYLTLPHLTISCFY